MTVMSTPTDLPAAIRIPLTDLPEASESRPPEKSPTAATVASYLGDLIAVTRHVSEAVARHAKDDRLRRISRAGAVIDRADASLKRHLSELEAYAKMSGGTGAMGAVKETLTSVTGFITGLYGTMRGEAASRMLRDDYTGVCFLMVCTQMLHTTALAVGEVTVNTMLVGHMEELAGLVIAINDVLPAAVVADLGADGEPISNPRAADEAAPIHKRAWRWAEKV
jgi:hypothetical protein